MAWEIIREIHYKIYVQARVKSKSSTVLQIREDTLNTLCEDTSY